jgi:hypothetical protein
VCNETNKEKIIFYCSQVFKFSAIRNKSQQFIWIKIFFFCKFQSKIDFSKLFELFPFLLLDARRVVLDPRILNFVQIFWQPVPLFRQKEVAIWFENLKGILDGVLPRVKASPKCAGRDDKVKVILHFLKT